MRNFFVVLFLCHSLLCIAAMGTDPRLKFTIDIDNIDFDESVEADNSDKSFSTMHSTGDGTSQGSSTSSCGAANGTDTNVKFEDTLKDDGKKDSKGVKKNIYTVTQEGKSIVKNNVSPMTMMEAKHYNDPETVNFEAYPKTIPVEHNAHRHHPQQHHHGHKNHVTPIHHGVAKKTHGHTPSLH